MKVDVSDVNELTDEPLNKHNATTKKDVADCIDQFLEELYNFVRARSP